MPRTRLRRSIRRETDDIVDLMLGRNRCKEILQKVLGLSRADQTEALIIIQDISLTRFWNSTINQNVSEKRGTLFIRVVMGRHVGSASTHRFDDKAIQRGLEKATERARLQPPNGSLQSLPRSKPIQLIRSFHDKTARYSSSQRAEDIQRLIQMASEEDLLAHGAHCTGAVKVGIANSLGVDAHCTHSGVTLNTTMTGQGGSGYSRFASRTIEEMDIRAIGREALEMCLASRGAGPIEPGNYEVVLNSYAVNDLLVSMAPIGLNALAFQEGRSFMCNQLGKKLLGENVTIWDNGLDMGGFNTPFDFEGMPKREVTFFQNGIAKGVTHDSLTAGKVGVESTGHRSLPPGSGGPIPRNLFMRGGNSSLEEMIRSTERGIYIHRFHYVNVSEPKRAIITGMTRDGTFLIEGGKMTKPLKNLRFTQSILDALSAVSLISKETKLVAPEAEYEIPFLTGSVVPALKIENFSFSGVSEAGSIR